MNFGVGQTLTVTGGGHLETQGNSGVPPWGSPTCFGGGPIVLVFGSGVQEGGSGAVQCFHLWIPRGMVGGPAVVWGCPWGLEC